MAVSATFVEPYFSRPQDAIVNAAGGIGAYVLADKTAVEPLWYAFLGAMIFVLVAGLTATMTAEGPGLWKWASFRISSRFGRAVVVGTTALLLIVLTEAASRARDIEYLAGAVAALVTALAVDWASLLFRVRRRHESATAVAAIGPRMVLATSAGSSNFHEGDPVEVEADGRTVAGSVVARLPHQSGLRYQIALTSDWTATARAYFVPTRPVRTC